MSDTVLLYDATLKKVGCVLLQAVYGGDGAIAQRIDNDDWFLAPTKDMRLYRLTRAQADQLVAFHDGRRAKAAKRSKGHAKATAAA
jgi:hypothetical protein